MTRVEQSLVGGGAALKQASKTNTTVDYESFLKLLIAQLKNQDPTKPMESTQFVSQLASFSAVEQQISTNTRLDELLHSSNLAQASSLVGRYLKTIDGTSEGQVKEVRIASGTVTAVLVNGQSVDVSSGVVITAA